MATLRQKALMKVQGRSKVNAVAPSLKISDYFGSHVFGLKEMQETLASPVFKKVKTAIEKGTKIDMSTADEIATAVKGWAMSKGATHYTHWFQPLTGSTAEKHDTFFDAMSGMERFKGSTLVQQEPDASSFPNGGIRTTFEARGYTAWDPSSPIFIFDQTLCIPTIFVSYTGEALDFKTPLIRSTEAINSAAVEICQLFDRNVKKVNPSLGVEQEYFVVDRALYATRPDLVMAGRSVFGHNPARGQQLDDHYFGSIPSRVKEYMKDFEIEALKLGIPVSTRHNEVAPGQFEVAPLFEDINKATDHNLLLMEVMEKVAEKHGLKVLFHEKPFAGLNGSGKHNNWSLITDTGVNLFQPSNSARENLQFLCFLVATIKAVYENADLLRASIASAGNDFRLGANEAPPAIISIFLGSTLTSILDELEKNGNLKIEKGDNMYMKLGISKIPEIILDNTDRNRTSPFAFTGNKFEFRAVGSTANPAGPMTALNVIVADVLQDMKKDIDKEISGGKEKKLAIVNVLRKYIKDSKKVRFEGDGYSEEWANEAEKRGLSNLKSTAEALDVLISKKVTELYGKHKVLNERELHARHEIRLENYIMKVQIESRVMGDLALNHIIPTAILYQNKLITNANGLKGLGLDNSAAIETIEEISRHIESLKADVGNMIEARKRVNKEEDIAIKAKLYSSDVKETFFDKIRYAVDKLELLVDDESWPLVKYREMLFLK
ncbi:glutamine synthetase III [Cyclobacterium sp. 1_MG-2023]|uniref:glutamine synthetase III family protein n=1 Tax=Cyclobacterium sp. 1_MG-2023 TaxID=3062681 RepID=UPI0026E1AF69|nr:glutamine synthetase III [Cyclobacterium sp. 1_MG-2023]MDO6437249.1 glutamine synthetase III [Cyclobacterium sp. 1_MG-2023]|eukprot:TRINITY_DN1380_c0_g1_i1.p1 TRINITY_DN1380_c0_g1~~TRINITY_DN1380_c0_g1_i1.p1  ORF type:complete len:721 (-),score=-25.56 TRINITY_DN1380_c0_g1_i1:740-2902(-)